MALKDKSGSSPYAIGKYMEEKHKAVLPANFKKILALQLKNSEARGKLIKVRASYKLSEAGKKDKSTGKTQVAKPKTEEEKKKKKKTTTKTKTTASAPKAPKKKPAKKTKKSTPAKPRSLKSPTARKPKKAVA